MNHHRVMFMESVFKSQGSVKTHTAPAMAAVSGSYWKWDWVPDIAPNMIPNMIQNLISHLGYTNVTKCAIPNIL